MSSPALPSSDRPLRIAIVAESFLPKVDGVTRTLCRLLQFLQAQGHEVLLLGPQGNISTYAGHKIKGTRGIPLPFYPGLALNFFRPSFLSDLQEFNPDVIHYVDPIWLGCQAQLVAEQWLPDIASVSSYHTNLAMYATMFSFGFLTDTIWNLQRYLHSRCVATYCPSPSTQRALQQRQFSNVRVWSRGVDTTLFNPSRRDPALGALYAISSPPISPTSQLPAPDSSTADFPTQKRKVVITYVGRISWEKNIALLVEAFAGLEEAALKDPAFKGVGCCLQFVGHGPAQAEIERLCREKGVPAVFTGYREGDELARCYASSDIFACPSISETFCQVVLEALASGLPVVGIRAEGIQDLIEHQETGLLLEPTDLDPTCTEQNVLPLFERNTPTFSKAVSIYRSLLLDLVVHDAKRTRMASNATNHAGQYSWSQAMQSLLNGYEEAAAMTKMRRANRLSGLQSLNLSTSSLSSSTSTAYTSSSSVASDDGLVSEDIPSSSFWSWLRFPAPATII